MYQYNNLMIGRIENLKIALIQQFYDAVISQ